jgi:hypothetical protein
MPFFVTGNTWPFELEKLGLGEMSQHKMCDVKQTPPFLFVLMYLS